MSKKVFDKNKILDLAVELAKEVGLDKISMRKLAKKLNCSVMPIYDSFECKEELLDAVFEKVMNETNSGSDYFVRNREILLYGIKYPLLYRDIRKYGDKSKDREKHYRNVVELMRKEIEINDFSIEELESLNFDILIYINGLVERSMLETMEMDNIEQVYLKTLNQVTKLFILGYREARKMENLNDISFII